MLVWPLWNDNTFVWDAGVTIVIWEKPRVRCLCDHCDMITPSCETLVWPLWYENTVVCHTSVSHECALASQCSLQHLTRRCSHITKVTPSSDTKFFSYHVVHTSISHEVVVISQCWHQRLTRRCYHTTKVTPVSHTWQHFMWDASVTIVIWEQLRVRCWYGLCDMTTTSCETLVIPLWY
jgi:ectoine hydroxylase-related dioxygenase (phytanoyl-CoA dioxygenase family)